MAETTLIVCQSRCNTSKKLRHVPATRVIPSPGFLQSAYCCREVAQFQKMMERRGRKDLILPIHYLNVDAFETVRRPESWPPWLSLRPSSGVSIAPDWVALARG